MRHVTEHVSDATTGDSLSLAETRSESDAFMYTGTALSNGFKTAETGFLHLLIHK